MQQKLNYFNTLAVIMMYSFLYKNLSLLILAVILSSCSSGNSTDDDANPNDPISFYYGADLSYVNEMEDCGAIYKDKNGIVKDTYQIFKDEGANIIRVRLWHNPAWTNYSNFDDVKHTIQRAKSKGMRVLLDFHYSDTWADPGNQQIPAAWIGSIDDTNALGILLYNYTFDTLNTLANQNLLPDIVQIGNEINAMILQDSEVQWPINWERNSYLINKGIQAVRAISTQRNKTIEVMLHIAQPENGLWWFEQATQNGITDFDWIGLSYYPVWSTYTLTNVGFALSTLKNTYNKKLMVVETAYPFTLTDADSAANILGENSLINGYPATQQGQLDYLNQLAGIIKNADGEGLIYWEPAWVSTNCNTLWGQGSHWDNATLFDTDYKATLGLSFYNNAFGE